MLQIVNNADNLTNKGTIKVFEKSSDILRRPQNLKKIFQMKFNITEKRQILSGGFFQILWPSQNIRTLKVLRVK